MKPQVRALFIIDDRFLGKVENTHAPSPKANSVTTNKGSHHTFVKAVGDRVEGRGGHISVTENRGPFPKAQVGGDARWPERPQRPV